MNIKRKYYLLALSLIPLILILRIPQVTQKTQMTTQAVTKPLMTAGHSAARSLSDFFEYFFIFWRTFEVQQQNLKRISELESQLELYKETRRENERLKKVLDLKEKSGGKVIAARVIGWDLAPLRNTVILDKGKHDGIREEMALIVPEGLAGRIIDVGRDTSRAILLNDPDARISALAADSRAQGVVAGTGYGELLMRYLNMESGAAVGETVLSSGVTGLFPKGLRIGKIKSIEKDKDGLHLVANIIPFVNFNKVEEVLCVESLPQE